MKLLHRQPTAYTARRVAGQSFVFTGQLEVITQMEARDLVRYQGGFTEREVTASTTFLVVGSDPAQEQLEAAHRFAVPLIDEGQFLRLLGI